MASVTLILGLSLLAMLVATSEVVTQYSLNRSADSLVAAHRAFSQLVDTRAQSAAKQARLIVELPVFREALGNLDTAADAATMNQMAEDYCRKLGANLCVVSDGRGVWVDRPRAEAGGPGAIEALAPAIASAHTGEAASGLVTIGGDLFLVASEPARFGREILGTFTAGFRLDDGVARELASVTHCDVSLVCGASRICGSSLLPDARTALVAAFANGGEALGVRDAGPALRMLGAAPYVGGLYSLSASAPSGTGLVLLQDWRPTELALHRIRIRLSALSALMFVVAIAGAVVFSRRTTLPLRDLANVADKVATGQWSERVPVYGPAEARTMADAFNRMTVAIRQREDQLRQAQKMEAIGRFAGGVAHDFNNLLTAMLGYADLLMDGLPADDPMRSQIAEIQKAGRSAASLTRDLLAFSRKQVLSPVALDLNDVVSSSENLLRRLIGEDIDLVTALEPDLRAVKADPAQIEQVLVNLAVNARDAMPDGGRLTITTANLDAGVVGDSSHVPASVGPGVVLIIRDNGLGMTNEVRSHIFEPFFTTKSVGHGTGLGLATVYGIVQQSGGHVWVDSAPGCGSTFTVCLPASTEPVARPAPAPDRTAADHRGTEMVLVVEDNDAVRAMARETLVRCGYRVVEATNGHDALQVVGDSLESISLVLTDVIMPLMGGRELASRLRARRPELKFIFTSGYSSDPIVGADASDRDAAFLQKPFSPALLGRTVRDVIDRR